MRLCEVSTEQLLLRLKTIDAKLQSSCLLGSERYVLSDEKKAVEFELQSRNETFGNLQNL